MNELQVMQGFNLPDHARGLSKLTDGMAGGFEGHNRIRVSGGTLSCMGGDGTPLAARTARNGEVVTFPQNASSIKVIILGVFPAGKTPVRLWYNSAYRAGETTAPACWSIDNVTPSAKSSMPQSASCATCKHNVVGTSVSGKGKSCSSRKEIVVCLADDPDMTLFNMSLSATAVYGKSNREVEGYYPLLRYCEGLVKSNIILEAVETEISFADGALTGVRFKPVGFVSEDKFNRAVYLRDNSTELAEMLNVDYAVVGGEDGVEAFQPPPPAPPAPPAPQALPSQTDKEIYLASIEVPDHLLAWVEDPRVTVNDIKAHLGGA